MEIRLQIILLLIFIIGSGSVDSQDVRPTLCNNINYSSTKINNDTLVFRPYPRFRFEK